MALTWINDRKALVVATKDNSPAVRLSVLLAMRRLHMPEIALFLNDADTNLVLEAARAINDEPVDEAAPQLAALASRTGMPFAFTYRALNARFRSGQKQDAVALAQFAATANAPEPLRLEALKYLGQWENPPLLDRVTGLWRPALPARSPAIAADAMRAVLGGIVSGPSKVREEAARVAGKLGIKEIGPALFELVSDQKQPASSRIAGLKGLQALKDQRLTKAVDLALVDPEPSVRAEGLRLLALVAPMQILPKIEAVLHKGEIIEQQKALVVLGDLKEARADELLGELLDKLQSGKIRPELHLELLEAAGQRKSNVVKAKLAKFETSRPKNDALSPYWESLAGGDAESGRRIFFEKSEVACVRCHKINGTGGEVGPDLSHIAKEYKRDYLLESIVVPSKQIAKGYENITLALKNGTFKSGILKSEDAKQVTFLTAEGTLISVPTQQVQERFQGKSAMPEDLIRHLSKSELRDLVEFLSSLR
jgi:quinoprotein glucose dehydrogenase